MMGFFSYRYVAAAAVCILALGMPESSVADETDWKIGVVDAENYFLTELTEEWASLVQERSGDGVSYQMFPSGQLGSDVAMLETLRQGSLQVWEGGALTLAPFSPLNDAWALPYLFDNDEHRYRFWDAHFGEISDLIAKESGYRIVAVLNGPARQLNTKKPIVDVSADVKGLKLRVPELQALVAFWQKAGAGPTAMPFTEVYSALETGVIDGQENDMLATETSGFFEVTSHIALIDYVAYDAFIAMSDDLFQSLPEAVKTAIASASEDVKLKSRELANGLESASIERAKAQGITFTDPDTAALREVGVQMRDDYPHLKPIFEFVEETR